MCLNFKHTPMIYLFEKITNNLNNIVYFLICQPHVEWKCNNMFAHFMSFRACSFSISIHAIFDIVAIVNASIDIMLSEFT